MRPDEHLAHWARMEAKSESTTEDLLRQVAPTGRSRQETLQLAWGIVVLVAVTLLSATTVLWSSPTQEVDQLDREDSLARQEYHFRP